MHALTIALTDFFARYPRVGGIFGLVIALAFGYLGFTTWQELQTMPQEPLALSLADATAAVRSSGQDQWVALDAVVWDCINIVQEGDRTSAIFTDQGRSVLGLATFSGSGELTCDDLSSASASGIVRLLSDGEYERLTSRGFDLSGYGNATARVALCTFCGRSNSRLLVILSGVMVLLGLAMYPLSLYLRRQRDRNEVRQGPIGLGAVYSLEYPSPRRRHVCSYVPLMLRHSKYHHKDTP